jgi:hypothetical protein
MTHDTDTATARSFPFPCNLQLTNLHSSRYPGAPAPGGGGAGRSFFRRHLRAPNPKRRRKRGVRLRRNPAKTQLEPPDGVVLLPKADPQSVPRGRTAWSQPQPCSSHICSCSQLTQYHSNFQHQHQVLSPQPRCAHVRNPECGRSSTDHHTHNSPTPTPIYEYFLRPRECQGQRPRRPTRTRG